MRHAPSAPPSVSPASYIQVRAYLGRRTFVNFSMLLFFFISACSSLHVFTSVMEPDPQGSETFCGILIWNSDVMDPALELDLNLNENLQTN
jgi:hypothetical protein